MEDQRGSPSFFSLEMQTMYRRRKWLRAGCGTLEEIRFDFDQQGDKFGFSSAFG